MCVCVCSEEEMEWKFFGRFWCEIIKILNDYLDTALRPTIKSGFLFYLNTIFNTEASLRRNRVLSSADTEGILSDTITLINRPWAHSQDWIFIFLLCHRCDNGNRCYDYTGSTVIWIRFDNNNNNNSDMYHSGILRWYNYKFRVLL